MPSLSTQCVGTANKVSRLKLHENVALQDDFDFVLRFIFWGPNVVADGKYTQKSSVWLMTRYSRPTRYSQKTEMWVRAFSITPLTRTAISVVIGSVRQPS